MRLRVSVALILVLTALLGNVAHRRGAGRPGRLAGHEFGLNFMISRRRAKFADQLPDMLQFVAGSLRSGFSLGQGTGRGGAGGRPAGGR